MALNLQPGTGYSESEVAALREFIGERVVVHREGQPSWQGKVTAVTTVNIVLDNEMFIRDATQVESLSPAA